MKKTCAILLTLVLTLSLASAALADTIGLGVVTGIASSKAATAEADGVGQVDTAICTVSVDDKGVIAAVLFDTAQTKVTFNAKGEITADLTAEYPSKYEKGDAYGMKKASPIGKEWFEQIDALVAYCTGKTMDEVLAGVKDGAAVDEDLKAGATMHLNDLIAALQKAYDAATK